LMPRDLADQPDHRRRILKGGVDAARGVADAGPTGHQQHPRLARELAVGLGHERGAAFLAAGHEMDLRSVEQRVEDLEIALSRNAEGHIDAMRAQRGGDELAAAEKIRRHSPTSSLVSKSPFETMR